MTRLFARTIRRIFDERGNLIEFNYSDNNRQLYVTVLEIDGKYDEFPYLKETISYEDAIDLVFAIERLERIGVRQ